MKRKIRITESQLNELISDSIKSVISEAFQSNTLRNMYSKQNTRPLYHGSNSFRRSQYDDDSSANGIPNNSMLYSGWYLDKITDDMIDATGTKEELASMGYKFGSHNSWFGIGSQEVYDNNGRRRNTMNLNNGTMIVFKNDDNTINKLRELGQNAYKQNNDRRNNKMNDGSQQYQWSTQDRGRAFNDWKNTGIGYWDKNNMFPDWRNDSWVKQNMDSVLKK